MLYQSKDFGWGAMATVWRGPAAEPAQRSCRLLPPVPPPAYNARMATVELPQVRQAVRAFLDVPQAELLDWLRARGEKPLRARQVRRWLLAGRAESFDRMT